jgi:hypothetical protein
MEPDPRRAIRLLLVTAALAAAAVAAGSTATAGTTRAGHAHASASLTGTWAGVLTGTVNGTTRHQRIRLTINTRHTGGRWKVDATCYGRLTLDSISGGSHHYLRHVARGAASSCVGGDIDCLWLSAGGVYDNVTPRPGGWSRNGTLHRVRTT